MSELSNLLDTVDDQRRDLDVLANLISVLTNESISTNRKLDAVKEEVTQLREFVNRIVKEMGFDATRLVRDSSCRVKT
jgi:hypothetical protein